MDLKALTAQALTLAQQAGEEIMAIYGRDFDIITKADDTPLTEADLASHRLIVAGLKKLDPQYPVLSEESVEETPWSERKTWKTFWLVDPIDGTKNFISRSGEFTVNIALIDEGRPVLGVVTAPALGEAFWGIPGQGAWKEAGERTEPLHVVIPPRRKRVVASKNHLNEETRSFIDDMGPHTLVQAGSSLKFCRIAEGKADIYPRRGPTCEWDTAAAQAVLEAAGGRVRTFDGAPLRYGKKDVLNPYFVAAGSWYGDA